MFYSNTTKFMTAWTCRSMTRSWLWTQFTQYSGIHTTFSSNVNLPITYYMWWHPILQSHKCSCCGMTSCNRAISADVVLYFSLDWNKCNSKVGFMFKIDICWSIYKYITQCINDIWHPESLSPIYRYTQHATDTVNSWLFHRTQHSHIPKNFLQK